LKKLKVIVLTLNRFSYFSTYYRLRKLLAKHVHQSKLCCAFDDGSVTF